MHNRKNVTINNICMKLNKATVRECQTVFFNKTQFHNEIMLLIVLHHGWILNYYIMMHTVIYNSNLVFHSCLKRDLIKESTFYLKRLNIPHQ